jgi:plasmid stability protein
MRWHHDTSGRIEMTHAERMQYADHMVNIQVRNVPADVHAVLKRRAGAAGQSLQEYVLGLLSTHAAGKTVAEVLAEIRAERESNPDAFGWTADEVTEFIRRDRASH